CTISSKDRSRSRLAVTSLYSVSMMASRSPSRVIRAPVVVLMVRMLSPEAPDGARLVSVNLKKVLGAGHRQHRLDPLLDPGELEMAARVVHLAIQIHEAADCRAVHVRDGREIDENFALARIDERAHGG